MRDYNEVVGSGCSQDQFFNPILTMGYQMGAILVLSHAFQLGLKFIPGPIAQILVSMLSIYRNMHWYLCVCTHVCVLEFYTC